MEQALSQANQAVQNIPGFGLVSGIWEDKSGEYLQTKDPFYVKVEGTDEEVRRQPPTGISEDQRKLWKKMIRRAWYHDRNFCHCLSIDLGLGMIQIAAIFPFIGAYFVSKMHAKMMKIAYDAGCPKKTIAIMAGNVSIDVAKAVIPLLGTILCWMASASTRNAALFDTWLRSEGLKNEEAAKLRQNPNNRPEPTLPPRAAQPQGRQYAGRSSQSPQPPPTMPQKQRSQPSQARAQQQRPPQQRPPQQRPQQQQQRQQPSQMRAQQQRQQPPQLRGQQTQQQYQQRPQQRPPQQYQQQYQQQQQWPQQYQQQYQQQSRQGYQSSQTHQPNQYNGAPPVPQRRQNQPQGPPMRRPAPQQQPYRREYPDGGSMRMPEPNPSAYPGPASMRMPDMPNSGERDPGRYPMAPPSYA